MATGALMTEATDHRRADILRAALDCFARGGYAATTIADIRRASGASVGSIYHHFANKEQLAAALYVDGLAAYQEGFLGVLADAPSAEAGIRGMVGFHLGWVRHHEDLARYLLAAGEADVRHTASGELRRINRRFFRRVAEWGEPYLESGALRRLAPDLYYALAIGPSQELARHWLAGRLQTQIDEAEPVLADAAWQALRGPKEDR